MLVSERKTEILDKIRLFKKKINDVDSKISLYLSDKTKYPHPGHESFINEVRIFENSAYSFPDKDVQYLLDNLLDSLRIHEKIWKQKFVNHENKNKKVFTDDKVKQIYRFYVSKRKENGFSNALAFESFKDKFNKAVEVKSESISSNETLKIGYSSKTGEILIKKEKIE